MEKPTKNAVEFNPIKEDKSGVRAKRMIWSTAAINTAIQGIIDGRKLVANPFYENNIKLLKGDLVFKRTDEEIEDFKHCMNDIIYFTSKCKLMTPEGIQHVTLRDYQVDYLNHLMNNRLSIFLSCRQSGKCVLFTTKIQCKLNNISDSRIKKYLKKHYYIEEKDYYDIPLFEVYNLFEHSIKWKFEYYLYKIMYKLICQKEKRQKRILGNV